MTTLDVLAPLSATFLVLFGVTSHRIYSHDRPHGRHRLQRRPLLARPAWLPDLVIRRRRKRGAA